MNNHRENSLQAWTHKLLSLASLAVVLGFASAAAAQNVIRVEEDWELVVAEPDETSVGPQVTTSMSPYNSLNDTYFTFEVNHRSVPSFIAGGLHLHLWNGDIRESTFSRHDLSLLHHDNEVINWTQILSVDSGTLTFQIKDGSSDSWGPFGYSDAVKVQRVWPLGHLNNYTPAVSIGQSGVGFASNRVTHLKLLRIRLCLSDGEVLHDNNVRVIFQQ